MVEKMGKVQPSVEDENDEIILSEAVVAKVVSSCAFSLVGKLLSSKKCNRLAMKESMRKAWGLQENPLIVEVGDNLFHFRFAKEEGMNSVLLGGPWNFDNHLLLLKPWKEGMVAPEIQFDVVDFRIQLHGLPFEYVSTKVGGVIGSKIGELLKVDDRTEAGEQGQFIRVKVQLNINAPLKRGGNIVCGGGRKVWVDYKYERLQSFYFYCGRIDHVEPECHTRDEDLREGHLRQARFGDWLKVSSSFRRGFDQAPRWEGAGSGRGYGSRHQGIAEAKLGMSLINKDVAENHGVMDRTEVFWGSGVQRRVIRWRILHRGRLKDKREGRGMKGRQLYQLRWRRPALNGPQFNHEASLLELSGCGEPPDSPQSKGVL